MKKYLVLIALPCLAQAFDNSKRLVIFAGPQDSGVEPVLEFYHVHAQGEDSGIQGWQWPTVPQTLIPNNDHHVFDRLVTEEKNATLQSSLLWHIGKAWNSSSQGIVLGSAEFDNTREASSETDFRGNGHAAIKRIVDYLGVPNWRVQVILFYRTPRLEQWNDISRHSHSSDGKHELMTYNQFICDDDHLWGVLEHQMNPLKLATVFATDDWWRVFLVDMKGVASKNRDLAHVVACDVLNHTKCSNGWLQDQESVVYNAATAPYNEADFTALKGAQKQELEELFLDRDCFYKKQLEALDHDRFQVLHPSNWKNCQPSEFKRYEELADTKNFLNHVKGQVDCKTTVVDDAGVPFKESGRYDTERTKTIVGIGLAFVCISAVLLGLLLFRRRRSIDRAFANKNRYNDPEWIHFDSSFRMVDYEPTIISGNQGRASNPALASAIRNGRSVRGMNTPTKDAAARTNLAPLANMSGLDTPPTRAKSSSTPNIAPISFDSMLREDESFDLEEIKIV